MTPLLKALLPMATLLGTLPSLSLAVPLPVIMPDSSGRVTDGEPGAHAHTRIHILVTDAATPANAVQINTPATLRAAYQLPSTGGMGAIAIVDAYHYPTALADFNTFGQKYSLPLETSTNATATTNKVLQVVYATGRAPISGGSYISSWNLEEALDIEWAHAIAPGAKIYLVEAASDSMADLLYAVMLASYLPGVHQVSMSWGSDETRMEPLYDSIFSAPGVTYFAAGGDSADALEYPSASPYVVSVGGTSLNRTSTGSLLSETCWNETGCGLSRYEARPSFQNIVSTSVGIHRGANDVSFVADPNTGVGVYDSTPLYGQSGWWVVGGTSLGTPAWAGVVNLASTANTIAYSSQAENTRLYKNLGNKLTFRDITSGRSGAASCVVGWDQPTGLGSPLGIVGK